MHINTFAKTIKNYHKEIMYKTVHYVIMAIPPCIHLPIHLHIFLMPYDTIHVP